MSEDERDKWNKRYSVPGYRMGDEPKAWLVAIADRLPEQGRAIDLAAGEGQNAAFLAERGLAVTAVDISEAARHKSRVLALEWGVSFDYQLVDLSESAAALQPGAFDLVTCFHFLHRPLAPRIVEALAPGGLVAVEILGVDNLERHERPSARYLVERGELRAWFEGELEILIEEEVWEDERFVCRVLARKPA